jgi:ADP-ribose pyrophosphatase YjhB (NUDIX family)
VLGVFDRDFRERPRWPAHVYKLYVECVVVGGEPAGDGVETAEASFFPVGGLPELSAKTPADHLERVLGAAADPARGAPLD